MYIVREIFHLHFGRYREAKAMIDDGIKQDLVLQPPGFRLLTDFTGEGYRMIIELPFNSLADYETSLKKEISADAWQKWYEKFKQYVHFSEREILKQVN
ncbi:MAG TPA: hypothetical protein PKC72_01670 [Chitinophagaceae bacterium]|nr:hypothetical protein [Chitinophagaceae bacterium]